MDYKAACFLSGFTKKRLKEIVQMIKGVKVGIVGDACLDIYWEADMTLSVLSRETPHFPLPVIKERYSPGAAANVAANVKSLNAANVILVTVIGRDWRGNLLLDTLNNEKIDTGSIIVSDKWITPAYCKPLRKGLSDIAYEDPRLDFENRTSLHQADEKKVLDMLDQLSNEVDVIAVADQLSFGIITKDIMAKLKEISLGGKPVIVDSRSRVGMYSGVMLKPNEVECLRAVYPLEDPRSAGEDKWVSAASKLWEKTGMPVIMTLGAFGSLWMDSDGPTIIPTEPASPPIDIVGAGDTFMAAFCCTYGAGVSGPEAAALANIASGIVVKKIGTTGTATPEEILATYKEGQYDQTS